MTPNEWVKKTFQRGPGNNEGNEFYFESHSFSRYSLKGFNLNLGTLWQTINKKLAIGVVYKTRFKADLKHESTFNTMLDYLDEANMDPPPSIFSGIYDEKIVMPSSLGVGFAYRFFNGFTLSFDIYRTNWHEFVLTNSEGDQISPISGQLIKYSNINPTYQIRLGTEYFIINSSYLLPLRAGMFYDPAPAEGTSDDYYGVSIGSGFKLRKFDFDIACQYRFGKNVGTSILKDLNFSQNINEVTVNLSFIYRFGQRILLDNEK